MMKLLIGPALTGTGYLIGSIYGRDVEQTVHKSPSATYDAITAAIANVPASGTTSFEGGTPMPYEVRSEQTGDRRIQLTLSFAGQVGAIADLDVQPGSGAEDALVTARFHGDRAVLQTALAGTDKARLAYAPDWILNLAARPLLRQVATEIENGDQPTLGGAAAGDARAQWEAKLSLAERSQLAEWQQYHATEPMTDLSAGADK